MMIQFNDNDESMPMVSIVIPTKNRLDSLNRLLDSIAKQDYPNTEVIIIDDGSDVAVNISDLSLSCCLVRNEISCGASSARNTGFRIAKGKYCLFFDDDAELIEATSITRTVAIAGKYPNCGSVAFKQLTSEGKASYMQPTDSDQICYTAYFFSYACLVSKKVFEDIGGFDESFQYYYEEVEFCLRLHNAGYKTIYDPNLKVNHHHDLRGRDWNKIYRFTMRNAILTAMLYYPIWLIVPATLRFMVKHIQVTKTTGIDWNGIPWLFKELSSRTNYVRQNRKSISFNTLNSFKKLKGSPTALDF